MPSRIVRDAGARAVVGEHPELAEVVRRADDDRVVDPQEHRLEALVEVDPVGRRVEGAARLDVAGGVVVDDARRRNATAERRRRSGAIAAPGPAGVTVGDVSSVVVRLVLAAPPGRNSVTRPLT